jgi:hypothetical protein
VIESGHGNGWFTIFNADDHFSVVSEGARLVCNDVPLIRATEDREKGRRSRHDGVLSEKWAVRKKLLKVGEEQVLLWRNVERGVRKRKKEIR